MDEQSKLKRSMIIEIIIAAALGALGYFITVWFSVLAVLVGIMAISHFCGLYLSPDALEQRAKKKEPQEPTADPLAFLKESAFQIKEEEIAPQLEQLKKELEEGKITQKQYEQRCQALRDLL